MSRSVSSGLCLLASPQDYILIRDKSLNIDFFEMYELKKHTIWPTQVVAMARRERTEPRKLS